MKKGIISRLLFDVNIDSGINFFIKPPKGGSPPKDRSAKENSTALVGLFFIFLKEDKP